MTSNSNEYNNHEIRENFKKLLKKKCNILTEIEVDDLEIGIFNASLDYAILHKIQLSWSNLSFQNTYINIARAIYSNLLENSYLGNNNLIIRLKEKNFYHMNYHLCQKKNYFQKNGLVLLKNIIVN